MKVYSHSLQGKRPTQEDNHFSFININNNNHEYNPVNIFCDIYGVGPKKATGRFLLWYWRTAPSS